MRISTINVSSVMLETKIFENPKLIIRMKSYKLCKPIKTKSIAKAGQGIRALHVGDTFLNFFFLNTFKKVVTTNFNNQIRIFMPVHASTEVQVLAMLLEWR